MVALIMLCSLIGSVAIILISGAITSPIPTTTSVPSEIINPPAIIREETALASTVIEEDYEIMYNEDMKNTLKEGIVDRSIEVMRKNGMSEEEIKKKLMESFSLDEETVDRLLAK